LRRASSGSSGNGPELGGQRLDRLRRQHGHRRIAVSGFPGVPVADDAEAGPDLDALPAVARLLGDRRPRTAVVAVLRCGEQAHHLDVVPVRQLGQGAQRTGPEDVRWVGSATSTSP
jgi:hypothetical protein